MLDAPIRRHIDPALDWLGRALAKAGVGANAVTLTGFAIGIAAVPAIALEAYTAGLVLIAINRLLDGLDGAVARHAGVTDFGGYLDIVCDFLFYAAVPVGFALADPAANAVAAAVLMLSFVGTGTTFLAYAIIAAKRGARRTRHRDKSFEYLTGITEGSETIAFFAAFSLLPQYFAPLAYVFAGLATVTAVGRVLTTWRDYGRGP